METAIKPRRAPDPLDVALVLTYADLQELSKSMRINVSDKDTLLAAIGRLNRLSVGSVSAQLEPRLLERLKSRCLDKERFPQWLAEVVVKQLHDYAGW